MSENNKKDDEVVVKPPAVAASSAVGEAENAQDASASCPAPPSLPLPTPSDPSYAYPPSMHDDLKPLLETTIVHPALIIPARRTAELRRTLTHVLMHRPKMKDVYEVQPAEATDGVDPRTERKLALAVRLAEPASVVDDCGGESTTDDVYADAALAGLLVAENPHRVRKSTHRVTIDYNHYTVEEVLRRVLPRTIVEVPSSFETAGHLAHVNLREEVLPYKHIIGRTILDKNPGVDIVVNKVGTIENEFRTFPMEVLARRCRKDDDGGGGGGTKKVDDDDTSSPLEVEVKEGGCRFRLDFRKVYWNSRLQYEHRRLVELIAGSSDDDGPRRERRNWNGNKGRKKRPPAGGGHSVQQRGNDDDEKDDGKKGEEEEEDGEPLQEIVIADVMAGVGPFAVPLTSRYRSITCHANDLNPVSYRYLNENARLNRCGVEGGGARLVTYNMDGRAFVRHLQERDVRCHHVIMNLPASAPEFLDAFRGWSGGVGGEDDDDGELYRRPMLHVHCFGGKDEGADGEAIARCERALGCKIDVKEDEVYVHVVRDVSPKKNMLCVSFRLPAGVSRVERIDIPKKGAQIEKKIVDDDASSPETKKLRTE